MTALVLDLRIVGVEVEADEPADCCGCTSDMPCDAACDGGQFFDGGGTHCTRCARHLMAETMDETEAHR